MTSLFDIDIHEKLMSYSELYDWFCTAERENDYGVFSYFNGINDNRTIFQLYHDSFIDKIAEQIKDIKPTTTIEIMAGDGKLSEFLNERHNLNIIPTDNKSWEAIKYPESVIELDALDAINKYEPDLIIVCWEPYESTLCADIVKMNIPMIWIGEGQGGCCGDERLFKRDNVYALDYKCCLCRTDSVKYNSYHSNIYLFNWPKLPSGIEDKDWYEYGYY